MATNALGITVPAGGDAFDPQGDMVRLANSLRSRVVVPVSNVAARTALVDAIDWSPSTAEPLRVHRADAPVGRRDEITYDGTSWRLQRDVATGRVPVSQTGLVAQDAALTAVITVPALPGQYRVIVTAMGKSGNAASARNVAWGFDSHAGGATVDADPIVRVPAAASTYATVVATSTITMPAGVDCTFRLMYRGDNNGFNSGAVTWVREQI